MIKWGDFSPYTTSVEVRLYDETTDKYNYIGKLVIKYNYWNEVRIVKFEPYSSGISEYELTEGKLLMTDVILRMTLINDLRKTISSIMEFKPYVKLTEI